MIFSSRALISAASQKKFSRSWTHSKYETVTPPALARMSGTTRTPASRRIRSASGVVAGRDRARERAGRQDLALDLEQPLALELLGGREAGDRAGLLDVAGQI